MTAPNLRLTVPLHADETHLSFVSRLAARNGTDLRSFCADFGLPFQRVIDGDKETLRQAAALAGVDPNFLQSTALVRCGVQRWTYRNIELRRAVLRRERIMLCAACALFDIKSEPDLQPNAAVYGRAAWLLDRLRSCPIHRIPLFAVRTEFTKSNRHDFAHYAGVVVPDLADLAASSDQRDLSALESYSLGRLAGTLSSPLLDPMPLAAATRLCETAGALLISDAKIDLRLEDDRHLAGARGFEAIAAGADNFRALLDDLIVARGPRARNERVGFAFGRLFTVLKTTLNDPAYDVVRDLTRRHAIQNFALAGGHDLIGGTIERRHVHSVHTLAKEHGFAPKTLRKHLKAAGLVSEAQERMSDNNVRIDAEAAIALARKLADTLSLPDAGRHINATKEQMYVLIKAGVVSPYHNMFDTGAQKRYAKADLDDLMARLYQRARSSTGHEAGLYSIPTVAKQIRYSAAEIVRLVLDGKLRTVKSSTQTGYIGVLVDANATLRSTRGLNSDVLPLRKAARLVRLSVVVLQALIALGHITVIRTAAINRRPQIMVAIKEINNFKAKFVSLKTLSEERRISPVKVKQRLESAGIEPVFDPIAIGTKIYRRSEATSVLRSARRDG
jgi:hypothetical protein